MVTVGRIEAQTDRRPGAEPLPRLARQPAPEMPTPITAPMASISRSPAHGLAGNANRLSAVAAMSVPSTANATPMSPGPDTIWRAGAPASSR